MVWLVLIFVVVVVIRSRELGCALVLLPFVFSLCSFCSFEGKCLVAFSRFLFVAISSLNRYEHETATSAAAATTAK